MGPDSYRTAGLPKAIKELGLNLHDLGNLTLPALGDIETAGPGFKRADTIGWTRVIAEAAQTALNHSVPIFLGGDHSLSHGSVLGSMRHAQAINRPLFVLWLDAHSDFHTPNTSASAHLHGTPLGYLTGREGFEGFPTFDKPLTQENICLLGLRSVDAPERAALQNSKIICHDMRAIDEHGIGPLLAAFLAKVKGAHGLLHVSLDVDFIDPIFAPAVGTTVPGGATLREAHLAMEMICDSGLLSALDLVELNPFLDERGKTAQVMSDLAASALGRRVFDRLT